MDDYLLHLTCLSFSSSVTAHEKRNDQAEDNKGNIPLRAERNHPKVSWVTSKNAVYQNNMRHKSVILTTMTIRLSPSGKSYECLKTH